MKIKFNDIKIGNTIRTPLLPMGFIERVQEYKKILSEVEKTTIEETILNFQKDDHPEKELVIWEYITSNYQNFMKAHKEDFTLEAKKDVLRVLLGLSAGAETFEGIQNLSKQQVQELKNSYLNYD